MNHRLFLIVFLLGFSLIFSPYLPEKALAKSKSQKTLIPQQKHLIETKMDLGLFGLFGGGMNYYLDGKPIIHYQDFKKIIYPIHDEEASKLIRDAEEADIVSWILFTLGISVGVDVALAFKPVPVLGLDWTDRISTGFVASQAFLGVGFIFRANAEGRKYNAVQRYNHLVWGKESAGFKINPSVFASRGHWALGLNCEF